ncbi:error-prone DNA polymerase [Burkholderia pseudomallei]|uniref:error-prone DNA polymerase n=1 Tax=Burkholderia pseudomallei TaxID=28450 RepID=UPI000F292FD3|nr:error-prone DNA polymerase [Burkholderia pseudomallei]CAJ3067859.1 DNA polymerase III subunit alpha [Burkholderia pseudomallei]VCK73136.1 DNA polymerase III subunit alpha [Burkholderia pseudomallei]VCK79817.1 DNA polymerase III subunit alpha [Burkholderia pseudomallei]VCK80210.1 DNA polymerase III subunit alpha [Burkholderia pseudomallei]VCK80990.1 DNA polymerase III subunit alpha [Burkholderia pseudomallei]
MSTVSPTPPSSPSASGSGFGSSFSGASFLPDYGELSCVSNFTFLRGASHAEELVARAAQLGYTALAIADECSMAGIVRAHVAAKEAELPLIVGSRFRLVNADGKLAVSIIALAQNRDGYGNLCELITLGRTREGVQKGSYRLATRDLDRPEPPFEHLRRLPDCLVIVEAEYGASDERLLAQAEWARETFPGRAWLGLCLLHRSRDDEHEDAVRWAARESRLPIVALGGVEMHVRSRKPLHDALTATRLGKPIAECGFDLAPNAERCLRSRLRLANLYPREAMEETARIAELCDFSLDELRYEYPREVIPEGETPASYLRKETYLGAQRRFPRGVPTNVQSQIEHELELIAAMRYESYFLTVYDIVRFARSQHILCQGRGSAANSAVCYCLGITEVDPERGNLLFERFISKERGEPPDIDVDFEHQRREEVIQYIYRKYGRHRAALAAAVISYRSRSALRDMGKALGVDLALVEQVAKAQHWWDNAKDLAERFAEAGLAPESPIAKQWASLAHALRGFPRHLSQHVGGFVISHSKLSRLVPIENASMEGRSVIEWDKDDLEALGLLKVDVLALGMLSAIRRALDFVSEGAGEPFEMQDIPKEDPETYAMIGKADTVGVFQIESRAQMTMLPRLKPERFYDLVIEISLIRPGPIQGGMVHPYLRRRQGLEPVSYPSPEMEAALSRTLGVPIFQEQVMQVAMLAAGFTPGEADQLRRSMAAWKRKGGLGQYYDRILDGMTSRGYTVEFAESIFKQIQGFGEYGFPESHAASFAVLVYASSWLKRHHPAAFLAALLNSQPMGFYSPSALVQDARRHGVRVLPVDVCVSDWVATLEAIGDAIGPLGEAGRAEGRRKATASTTAEADSGRDPTDRSRAVRLGLSQVRSLSNEAAWRIEEARAVRPFESVADLALRATLNRHDLDALAHAGALAALAGNRREALWHVVASLPDKDLLRGSKIDEEAVHLPAPRESEEIVSDYRALGLTLGRHPLSLLRKRLSAQRFMTAQTLNGYPNGRLARACGIVTVRQRPGTASGVVFVTLEDETGNVNVIVWPKLVEHFRKPLLGASLLGVYGTWQEEGGVRHLVAQRLVDLSPLLGELVAESRDFC